MDFCTCLLNSHSLSSMKDDAYIYNNNVITCIFWCKILGRADALNRAALRHHKKMLHYQNKRLQKCVSQILFVLLQCHSELCFIFTAR